MGINSWFGAWTGQLQHMIAQLHGPIFIDVNFSVISCFKNKSQKTFTHAADNAQNTCNVLYCLQKADGRNIHCRDPNNRALCLFCVGIAYCLLCLFACYCHNVVFCPFCGGVRFWLILSECFVSTLCEILASYLGLDIKWSWYLFLRVQTSLPYETQRLKSKN